MNIYQPRGFVALMSTMVISVVLLLVASTGSLTGFYSRFNILDSEYKERSNALAEACADQAMLELMNNINYAGDATTTVGSNTCYVGPITGTTQKKFKTRGYISNSYTNISVIMNQTTGAVVSWEEVANF